MVHKYLGNWIGETLSLKLRQSIGFFLYKPCSLMYCGKTSWGNFFISFGWWWHSPQTSLLKLSCSPFIMGDACCALLIIVSCTKSLGGLSERCDLHTYLLIYKDFFFCNKTAHVFIYCKFSIHSCQSLAEMWQCILVFMRCSGKSFEVFAILIVFSFCPTVVCQKYQNLHAAAFFLVVLFNYQKSMLFLSCRKDV